MTPVAILTQARELLADPHNWGQNHMRNTDRDGNTRRCSLGALWEVSDTHPTTSHTMVHPSVTKAIRFLAEAIPDNAAVKAEAIRRHQWATIDPPGFVVPERAVFVTMIATYNDTHSHAEVIEVFDRAIEAAAAPAPTRAEISVDLGASAGILNIPAELTGFGTWTLTDEFMEIFNGLDFNSLEIPEIDGSEYTAGGVPERELVSV